MSEIPALRDALVDAAARRARRRRRIAFRIVAWSAAATAAAAVIVLAAGAPREREVPAATPTPSGELERSFSAFRRPATAADAPPADTVPPGAHHVQSRLVVDANGTRVWLAEWTLPKVEDYGGRREFCAIVRGRGGPGGACGGRAMADGFVTQIPARNGRIALFVLPDGSGDPQVLIRGSSLEPEVRDNVALAAPPESIVSASYTDAAGVRRISRWRDLHAKGWTPQGCPALDPLPADAQAQAQRAALLAVSRVYPWIQEASVAGVTPVGPGLCTPEVTDRSLAVSLRILPFDESQRKSASLTQGLLLVGMERGRMTVWRVQH